MKSMRFFVYAAAALSLAACAKGELAGTGPRTITFHASMVEEELPPTMAVMGTSGNNKPQILWENGDEITVYTSAEASTTAVEGYIFSASLTESSASADFTYTGEGCASGNYLAIYPAASTARVVNFTGEGDIFKMAAVDVPSSQTLVAGSFDKKAAVATAYAPEGSSSLNFKNAVALIKFRVSGEGAVSGKISVDASDAISGRFRADLNITPPYEPVLFKYNQPVKNFVDFTIDGSTSFSIDTDYYIVVRPTDLTNGVQVYLNEVLVKSISADKIERNKVYNLGVLSVPEASDNKILAFDFTVVPEADPAWPTNLTRTEFPHVEGGIERDYTLDGTKYSFVLADCGQATNTAAQLYLHTSSKALVFNAEKRYLGLPAISGYKLTKVVCLNASGVTTAQFEIVKSISPNTNHPASTEIIAESQVWSTRGAEYTYQLSNTVADTRYYLYCISRGSVGKITLTYEPAQ